MGYLIILILLPALQYLTALLFGIISPEIQSFFPNLHMDSFVLLHLKIFLQQFVSICIPVLIVFPKRNFFPREEFHVTKPGYVIRCVILGILLQFIGVMVNFPVSVALQHFGFHPPASIPTADSVWHFALQLLVICLTPAIFEEVLFRRMIFDRIGKDSKLAAVMITALLFGMAHLDFYNFAATFAIGIVLGMLRMKGASLILCTITHFSVNLCASILNILMENATVSSLFERYFLLICILSVVFFHLLFPKENLSTSVLDEPAVLAVSYTKKLLRQPLFYIYLVIFFIIGARNL